jgi:hypothetical protein
MLKAKRSSIEDANRYRASRVGCTAALLLRDNAPILVAKSPPRESFPFGSFETASKVISHLSTISRRTITAHTESG